MMFHDMERIPSMDYMPHKAAVTGDTYIAVLQNLKRGHQEHQHAVTKTRADDNMCPASA
jgi:hypothetical protein